MCGGNGETGQDGEYGVDGETDGNGETDGESDESDGNDESDERSGIRVVSERKYESTRRETGISGKPKAG